jgi:hypothetical protein
MFVVLFDVVQWFTRNRQLLVEGEIHLREHKPRRGGFVASVRN